MNMDIIKFTEWFAIFKFTNTNKLCKDDIVFMTSNPITKIGNECVIRRALVKWVGTTMIVLLDLDNNKMFFWDNNCPLKSEEYNTYILRK